MKKFRFLIYYSFIPLVLSLIFYLMLREGTWINAFFNIQGGDFPFIQGIIRNNLPAALWIFSLNHFIIWYWDFTLNRESLLWLALSFGLCFLWEFFQLKFPSYGTYDPLDILWGFAGGVPALLHIIHKTGKRRSYEK